MCNLLDQTAGKLEGNLTYNSKSAELKQADLTAYHETFAGKHIYF